MPALSSQEKDYKIRPSVGVRGAAARVSGVIIYERSKRFIDCLVAGLGLLALSPLFALMAIAIKADSPGPVLFSQTRLGQGGAPFRCWKLRSMFLDAEQSKQTLLTGNEMEGGTIFKIKQDPRITRVGRFIRKASIDELPQLWNVWVGDMSLVGPRPPVPQEVANYTAYDRQRLMVKPGITCIWQVSGRSDIPFEDQVALDIKYIGGRSLLTDVRLLLRTIPAVLFARGAY
ncbi:sugar transferase [Halieaceae bacterium IMCC14734]|uniref:Sugar transferase n=1 Tax=Candidatus Litorirhabdus singularis TaxID=2518993 RepID=A0ABT3TFQ1_9GAMM|nr:sugar transferase [Candidatus Litorirhabdus singularis]MCX2980596.1 sugar transferase [Candidatus Litorirhabdus singularis]